MTRTQHSARLYMTGIDQRCVGRGMASSKESSMATMSEYVSGCNGYVAKPIDTRTFATYVMQFLPRHAEAAE